jgi:hypothetical protein
MKKLALLSLVLTTFIIFAFNSQPVSSKKTADEYVYLPIIQTPTNPYFSKIYDQLTYRDSAKTEDGGLLILEPSSFAKLGEDGSVLWKKRIPSDSVSTRAIIETTDRNIIVAGTTDTGVSVNDKAWIAMLDHNGSIIWQKSFTNGNHDSSFSILERTNSGGFLAIGHTQLSTAALEFWMIHLDKNGAIIWQKTLGNQSSLEFVTAVHETPDNGFIFTGRSESPDPQSPHVVIVKLNNQGDIQWQKRIVNQQYGSVEDLTVTSDGSSFYTGYIKSNHTEPTSLWVFKLDHSGNLLWSNVYGTNQSSGHDIFALNNNSIYATGKFTANGSEYNGWLINLDSAGNLNWQKRFNTSNQDNLLSIASIKNDVITMTGVWGSTFPSSWVWVLKTDLAGNTDGCPEIVPPVIINGSANISVENVTMSTNIPSTTVNDTNFIFNPLAVYQSALVCGE